MAIIADIEKLGYTVTEIGEAVWVEGFGVSTSFRKDDEAELAKFANKTAHAERVKQHEEGPTFPVVVDTREAHAKAIEQATNLAQVKAALAASVRGG